MYYRIFSTLGLAALFFAVGSCSDDDPIVPNIGEVNGVWGMVVNSEISSTCDSDISELHQDFHIIIRCEDEFTFANGFGIWGTGTLEGNTITVSGTQEVFDADSCTVTVSTEGTLTAAFAFFEGTFTTQYQFNDSDCQPKASCTRETEVEFNLGYTYNSPCVERAQFPDPTTSPFSLPWPVDQRYLLLNSYCLGGNRDHLAYDFLMDQGDTIIASRAGTVREVVEGNQGLLQGANYLVIEHSDGSAAYYGELLYQGVLVDVGAEIEVGESIALCGPSTEGQLPRFVFQVFNTYPTVTGDDLAVSFNNASGEVDCRGGMVVGEWYTAQ